MKALGLIGGTSWYSTIEYYRLINQTVNEHFGDNTNPPLLVFTLNHAQIRQFQLASNWNGIADMLIEAATRLEKAGAEKLMFCANTPHKVYDIVQQKIKTPIIHIADATAAAIKAAAVEKVCFLGTKYSMQGTFITDRLQQNGIEALVPQEEETVNELQRIIHEELTYGKVLPQSKAYMLRTIQPFINAGAQGVVLGCTEFPLIIKETELEVAVFNTAEIHAKAGAKFILSK